MEPRYGYILEHFEHDAPTIIGVFTSLEGARATIRDLPKSYSYTITKLPLNTILTRGGMLEDQQAIFDQWHYGTKSVEYWEYDENGELLDQGVRQELFWPESDSG